MPTEDHPIAYLSFEGTIPKGQYGGGTVMVWDIGTYNLIEGNVHKGHLKFYLSGKKLKGEWLLTRTRDDESGRPKWLMIRAGQKPLRISKSTADRSALSGRTMEQIAEYPEREWQSNRADSNNEDANEKHAEPAGDQAERGAGAVDIESLPKRHAEFIEPMLARLVRELPESADWQYELKLDGYRTEVVKKNGTVDVYSRRGNRVNDKFPSIAAAFKKIPAESVIDGELVVLDSKGKPDFNRLQNLRRGEQPFFYAFDVLAYKGRDLCGLPLRERRRVLESALIGMADPIRLSPVFDSPVRDIVRAVRENELEGIVAKRRDSNYEAGKRRGAWVKYKTHKGQELVIGGYIPGKYGFDALLVGYYDDGKLIFNAKVRNGFTPATRMEVAKHFRGLETSKVPFANLPESKNARRGKALTAETMKECRWLKPKLVARIEFADWTEENHLREATFAGLRDDKEPREVVREVA